ncbi:MAG: HAD-IA family hydrolase [Verrucomicrobiota bacterium]|nr:HAD-IA family hydrolase [Verrucomicrobiota bacterium]
MLAMLHGIEAITFDAGGTLIEPFPSVGAVYSAVAQQFGISAAPAQLDQGFRAAWKGKQDFAYSIPEWKTVVEATFQQTGPITPELFEMIYNAFKAPEVWKIFPDVFPTLKNLRSRGFRLAVISNWDERLAPLLGDLHLDGYFEAIIVSRDVGHQKPSPEIFHHALSLLKVDPECALHIGDSLREDVTGAAQVGMRAVWINRGNDEKAKNADTVHNLKELFVDG